MPIALILLILQNGGFRSNVLHKEKKKKKKKCNKPGE